MPDLDQINISVTDIIPPDNFATVDAGAKVGTVYTKEQDNEWRAGVEQNVTSGIKGVAKPDDIVPATGFFRMLANIAEIYTNYIGASFAPIEVTDTDLNIVNGVQRNEVIFEVTNGVTEKKVFAKVGADGANGTATIPKWVAVDYSPDAMVVDNFVQYIAPTGADATDIPGESDKWISVGNKVDVVNEIESGNSSDAVTGKAVSELMIGESVSVTGVPLNYTVGKYVDAGGTINPNGDTDFLTINIEAGEKLDYSMTMVQGVPPIIFKADDGQVINNIEQTSGTITVRTGVFEAIKSGVMYINVRTTQSVIVNYLTIKTIKDIYDEFESLVAVKYKFREVSELVRVEGSYMAPNGSLVTNAQTLHKKIDLEGGEAVNIGFLAVQGTNAWVLKYSDGGILSGTAGSGNTQFNFFLPVEKNGTLYLNQNIGYETINIFEISSKEKEVEKTIKKYIDSKNSKLITENTPVSETFIQLIPNAIFPMSTSQIGVTKYNYVGGASGYSISQLIKVSAGDKVLVSGLFGADNGVALFDNNGILAKKLLLGSNQQITDAELLIEIDGYIHASSLNSANNGFKLFNKKLDENTAGSGGVTIYYDRTLRPWAFGLKESNTEADNTAILNNLIFKANQENRSIELPEGIYKASNINFKPCHIYGKHRNTVLQTQSANPMFVMPDFDGQQNLLPPFYSGIPGRGNFPGFSVSDFCIDGKGIGTIGMNFGIHAFAEYSNIVISNFTQYAMKTKGMLICDFYNFQINNCANGIKGEEQISGDYKMSNLVTFHRLNIGACPGIGVDWTGGSLLRFVVLDTESCGTTGDVNTGVLFYRNGSQDAPQGQGVIIESSWAEIIKGGFYANLQGGAMHSIKNCNIKRDGDAQRAIINNGSTLLMENVYTSGGSNGVFDVHTLGGGQTMQQGKFTGFHSESTGGVFKTAQYL